MRIDYRNTQTLCVYDHRVLLFPSFHSSLFYCNWKSVQFEIEKETLLYKFVKDYMSIEGRMETLTLWTFCVRYVFKSTSWKSTVFEENLSSNRLFDCGKTTNQIADGLWELETILLSIHFVNRKENNSSSYVLNHEGQNRWGCLDHDISRVAAQFNEDVINSQSVSCASGVSSWKEWSAKTFLKEIVLR